MGEIDVKAFSGANNVTENFYSNAARGVVEPRIILNADVSLNGELIARSGKTLFITLAGAHSLWAGSQCMLCVAGGALYRISQGVAVNVGTVAGPKYPMSFVEADDKVYFSNPYSQGIFDPVTGIPSSWGTQTPPGPMLLSGNGALPAGTYHVTMTNMVNGELSGNGPITDITLSAEGGIQVLNRPSGALVWITDANEGIFYLVGATSQIVAIPTVEPLPTFLCSPPPYMENLCLAFGRMWGSSGPDLYCSEPFKYGLFKLASSKFSFDSKITVIAKVSTGLFIGMEDQTKFLAGTEPGQMVQSDVGGGSVAGSLAYCNNLPDLGSVLGTPEKGFVDVPVWLMEDGIVAGNGSGKVYNLTKNKIKMGVPSKGASLYRNYEGVFQFLTSFKSGVSGSGKGFSDAETYAAFKAGQIDVHNKALSGASARAAFQDDAVCEVRRGGILI
jgi:hypothetical protein